MAYKVNCIKCREKYDSDEPDAYYCKSCNKEKQKIAEEIDKKFAGRPTKKTMSGMEKYDSLPKIRGFVSAKDLGM